MPDHEPPMVDHNIPPPHPVEFDSTLAFGTDDSNASMFPIPSTQKSTTATIMTDESPASDPLPPPPSIHIINVDDHVVNTGKVGT